jgi:hypothetical protein
MTTFNRKDGCLMPSTEKPTKPGRVRAFISDLAHALMRVSADYKEAATLRGDQEFDIHVKLTGLSRPDASRLFEAVAKRTNVTHPRRLSDELERERAATIDVEVVGLSSIAAACCFVLEVLRADLTETGLAGQIESIQVEVSPR